MTDPLARWFRFLCKFGVPVILALFVGSLLSDRLSRWPVATSVLSRYPDQTAALVGFRYHVGGNNSTRSETYLLFPSLQSLEITVVNGAQPMVRESAHGLLGVTATLLWVAVAIGLSLWHWRHPAEVTPPNQRLERP